MMTNSDIELMSENNPSYITNNRIHAQRYRADRKGNKRDEFAICYNWHLRKWERVVQAIFAMISTPSKNRILRYCDQRNIPRYKEIDYVSQLDADKLIFCELKLKAYFHSEMGSKTSGWQQLNSSLTIAGQRYKNLSGLAICVDMSFVYQNTNEVECDHYTSLDELKCALQAQSQDQTLWIDSSVICAFAIKNNLLTKTEINEMHQAYQEYQNPMSVLEVTKPEPITNNPFSMLANLNCAFA